MLRDTTRTIAFARGVLRLRPERTEDEPFRFQLFCDSRPPGQGFDSLDPRIRDALLRQQFVAQSLSYRSHYPTASFDIVELDDTRIGRIVVACNPDALLVVDLAFEPKRRNQGIGEALVRDVMEEARTSGLPVRVSVFVNNQGSLRFCLRLGFKPVHRTDLYVDLEWRAPSRLEIGAR